MGRRWRLVLAAGIWAAGLVAGALAVGGAGAAAAQAGGVAAPLDPYGSLTLGQLLATNLAVVTISLAGLITAGLASVIQLALAGYLLGLLVATAAAAGAPPALLARALLPHGLLEITGLWLAGAAGLTGARLMGWALRPRPVRSLAVGYGHLAREVAAAGLLTVAAGLVEWFITPLFLPGGG